MSARTARLEKVVAQYEKSLRDLAAIEEELRILPASDAILQSLQINANTRASMERALELTRTRLESERVSDANRVNREEPAA